MNLSRIGGNPGVAALTPDVSVVSILALVLGVLLLSLGLLLGRTLAAGGCSSHKFSNTKGHHPQG
jgi:hypothetical protein